MLQCIMLWINQIKDMNTVQIFTGNEIHTLQDQINDFLDSLPKIKVIQVVQSSSNDWTTISIFYKI